MRRFFLLLVKTNFKISQYTRHGVLILLSLLTFQRASAINEANEYSIKAMFLINFIKYIDWPHETPKTVFNIGIVGDSEIYDELIKIPALKTTDSRNIIITKISSSDLSEQDMILISRSENKRLDQVVKKFSRKGVLIISEDVRLRLNQSCINLKKINHHVCFEINLSNCKDNGLSISNNRLALSNNKNQ